MSTTPTTPNPPTTPHPPHGSGNGGERPLFSLRTALLMLLALFLGFVIGGLTFAAVPNIPSAILAGLVAAGTVLYIGNKLIDE